MLRYDLSLFANPFYSGTYDRDYTNATEADVTQVTIENPRDQSEMQFQTNVDGDFADVDVYNDYPDAEHGDFDLVYAAQSVVPPAGYQGTDAVWAVWLQGPTTILPPFVEPWIDNHPPAELNLDDWPIATLEFWDGYFEDPTGTNIEADIYSLTPIIPPYLPGDYDFDGDVDAADYPRWRSLYGNDISLDANADADGNDDGVVDAADYVVWRKNLGRTAGSGSVRRECHHSRTGNVSADDSCTGGLVSPARPGRIKVPTSRQRATIVNNPPVLTHVFWHTKSVPENVDAELLRRI